jgi:ABC-type multidrug transport system fused ATPase/permease subunit
MARGRGRNKEERIKVSKESWKKSTRIFKFMRPYRGVYAIGMICLLVSTTSSLIFPSLLGSLLGADNELKQNEFNLFDPHNITSLMLLLIILFAFQALFSFFRIYLFGSVTEKTLRDLRKVSFSKLICLPSSYFDKNKIGELQSRVSSDIGTLTETFNTTIAEFIRQILTIIVGVTFIAFVSPKLALIMLAVVPVIAISAVVFGKFIRKFSKKAQDATADSNSVILDALMGIKNVKTYVNEQFELKKYGMAINEIKTLGIKASLYRGVFASFVILVMFGSVVLVIWQGVSMVQLGPENGGISNQQFNQFLLYTIMIGASFGGVSNLFASLQKAVGATERLLEILEEESEDVSIDSKIENIELQGNVVFKDVHFSYETRADLPVLAGINFEAKAGEQIAIVGPSGAGKSTISALLLRFYEPTTGVIEFDGKKSIDFKLSELRNQMAIVPQDVILYAGTIKENIAYGDPSASEDKITEAANKANALEFIEKFPEGMESLVGDRGIQLSGGQRQRIAIARAVLKDPKILILDEATSALDSESEHLVQEALDRLMTGRTSFVIAHRLSTIRNSDKILVIENGLVSEQGKHEELIGIDNGTYRHLSQLQFETISS